MKILSRFTARRAAEGECPPWYLGVCYHEWDTMSRVLAPIPLNFLIGWCREIWLRLRVCRTRLAEVTYEAYLRGRRHGIDIGTERMYRDAVRMWNESRK